MESMGLHEVYPEFQSINFTGLRQMFVDDPEVKCHIVANKLCLLVGQQKLTNIIRVDQDVLSTIACNHQS